MSVVDIWQVLHLLRLALDSLNGFGVLLSWQTAFSHVVGIGRHQKIRSTYFKKTYVAISW